MFPELLTGFKNIFFQHICSSSMESACPLQQKTRSYIDSFPSGVLIAVITAPQLKETLTPTKIDGAMFKHLTIANETHTRTNRLSEKHLTKAQTISTCFL
jgi:hypothetical protein